MQDHEKVNSYEDPAEASLETKSPEFFVQKESKFSENKETAANPLKELFQEVKGKCEKLSSPKMGVIFKLRPDLDDKTLHQRLIKAGAIYSITNKTYFFPPERLLAEGEKLANIRLADLVPGPNPRLNIDPISVYGLFGDIKENGLKERIKIRPSQEIQDKFEVVDGNRRVEVAKLLKWSEIPAIVTEMSDEDAYLAAFIINNDRKELNQYERGRWYKLLMKRFPEKFPSQRALSPYVAVNQSTIVRDIQYYEANAPKTPVNQHDADGIMDVSESTRGEANANTKDKNTTQTQTGTPSDIPSEFVDRQIRKFPAKMQDELRSQAAKEGLTAEQTRERGEILVIIGKVPERYRASLLEEARTQCWDIEQTEKVANEFIIKMPSDEEAEALWLAAGQKELRQEESKKRGLLKKGTVKVEKKEKLTKFYSETVLKIVIDRFGRQQKPDMILKIARKLCDLAVQTLTPEQLQEILKKISEAG